MVGVQTHAPVIEDTKVHSQAAKRGARPLARMLHKAATDDQRSQPESHPDTGGNNHQELSGCNSGSLSVSSVASL